VIADGDASAVVTRNGFGVSCWKNLDVFYENMLAGRVFETMESLVAELYEQRAARSAADWKAYVANTVMAHPIRELLHRDPFTFRAFSKPRGYAGDAAMLDMIYRGMPNDGFDEPVGSEIFRYTTNGVAPRAVRNRRQRLAALIDETVRNRRDARILALASGHLREIEISETIDAKFAGEIFALDQDVESLAVIDEEHGVRGFQTVHAPIKRLLAGRLDLRGFDLVYAAGLFDYLLQPVAKALCTRMFEMLNPGGRMLVANFVPGIPDVGYMESFMDWYLIYRNESEMRELASDVPKNEIATLELSSDDTGNIIYLAARRKERTP
jgi:extracellular factor (EF) 3-hydroxypalmitic acid methyl ester biosynthesis protein